MSLEMMREQARILLEHGWEDFKATVLPRIDDTVSREQLIKIAFHFGASQALQMLVVETINPMRYEIDKQRHEMLPHPPDPKPVPLPPLPDVRTLRRR